MGDGKNHAQQKKNQDVDLRIRGNGPLGGAHVPVRVERVGAHREEEKGGAEKK